MKKLIALAIVAVMLVAMAATVLANETVYAAPVKINDTQIGDGTISDGEYGKPVVHINSNTAYDVDHDDEPIEGYKGYAFYQNSDPFEQDFVIYIAISGDTAGANAKYAGDRLYIAADELVPDGKFYGTDNGMLESGKNEHWVNTLLQFRVDIKSAGTDCANGEDPFTAGTCNLICTLYTAESSKGYVTDGFTMATWDDPADKDNVVFSYCDHGYPDSTSRLDLKNSGCIAGSIGMHGNRAHYEFIIKNAYFANRSATFKYEAEVNDTKLAVGDKFAFSVTMFVNLGEGWNGLMSWGCGIDGPTNSSTMGYTGSNTVIVPSWDEYYGADEPDDPTPVTGDALVVVVATAVMALGTALIVKKVK